MRSLIAASVLLICSFAFAADPPSSVTPSPTPSASPAEASATSAKLAPTPTPAANEVRTDRLFFEGKVTDTPVFTQETHIDYDGQGGKTWTSSIKDADGQVVMTEIAILKNDRIVSQSVEQRQTGVAHELIVEGDKATFRKFELVDGKRGKELEHNTVNAGESFLTGPMTDTEIQKNWTDLMNGKTLRADFGVFEAGRTIEFKFSKSGDVGDDVEIHMKPASIFISAFVPTIKLRFNKVTHKLVYFSGPTPLKIKNGSKWKDFAAEIFYP